jgi:cytochrome oxidase Cu insertion factor (SCO1/SenC/PrrC family)
MNAPREHRPVDTPTRNRNRWMLVALFVMFFGALAIAGLLRFSGWRPEGLKNKGELIEPIVDLRNVVPELADGKPYRWKDAPRTWRIVAMTRDCDGANAAPCERLLSDLDKVWQLAGKDADRVHVLWVGTLPPQGPRPETLRVVRPTDTLRDNLPRAEDPKGMPVYLLDPNGFVVLRYAPGFDPADLRTDLSRLLKVN